MKRRLFLIPLLLALLLTACAPAAELDAAEAVAEIPENSEKDRVETPVFAEILCSGYDPVLTDAQLAAAEAPQLTGELYGAILPHYAPAMGMGASLLAARKEQPDTIVLAAPNHSGEGGNIQISGASYRYLNGSMTGNAALAETLAAALGLEPIDTAAREDWSAALQIPYLAHYFPEAEVVTILLSRGADASALDALAELLVQTAEETELLLIGSVDFSHEQSPEQAARCDRETQALISAGDPVPLLHLGNAWLDSPETVYLMMRCGELQGMQLCLTDHIVEHFLEDGRQMAGSYHAYALTADGGVPDGKPAETADDQTVPE